MKYSSGAPSRSTARTSSSAVTRLAPVSIADTVCRSLKPNISANFSWDRFRSSRSALIRWPISRFDITIPAFNLNCNLLSAIYLCDFISAFNTTSIALPPESCSPHPCLILSSFRAATFPCPILTLKS